jgi:tagatose 1,6-diphosphate aldolase GatY/KbaY
MLTPFTDLLAERPAGTAVGAFTCYDLEGAVATLRSADNAGSGVILLIGSQSYADRDGALLLAALIAAADQSDARACIQLDHCSDIALIESAFVAGVGAVMADGSALAYEDNVNFVRRAADLARQHSGAVEAELGMIEGDEDVAQAAAPGALTDPAQATDFIQRTGAACLAVSIGNVHGIYCNPPELDWDRLDAIRAGVSRPLSLHGASGIPDSMLCRSILGGIAKINVNTELRAAYLTATRHELPAALEGQRLGALHAAQVAAVEAAVTAKLQAFDTRGET